MFWRSSRSAPSKLDSGQQGSGLSGCKLYAA
jgi:hypothetical protein